MRSRGGRWFAKMRCVIQRLAAPRAWTYVRWRFSAMLIWLIVAMLPWPVIAETSVATLSNASEPAMGALRHGIITIMSNLRTSPSVQSEVVAIAKEGALVEILLETERWYRVRSEAGVEAWIYKSLVRVEREPSNAARETPVGIVQPDMTELLLTPAATPNVSIESGLEITPELQGSGDSSAAPIDEAHVPPERTRTGWFLEVVLSPVHGPAAYVILTLVIALALSIAMQLRSARQLRRAMHEIGQILDIVEAMYADAALTPVHESSTTVPPMVAGALTQQILPPLMEFSPIEQAVLEVLSDQRAVQEGELGKMLGEKGYAGTLIKAIIGDIVRKTGTAELPWIEVSYAQGRYSYRLRPEAASKLSNLPSERR
jgi:SH3-like domain-containing protein